MIKEKIKQLTIEALRDYLKIEVKDLHVYSNLNLLKVKLFNLPSNGTPNIGVKIKEPTYRRVQYEDFEVFRNFFEDEIGYEVITYEISGMVGDDVLDHPSYVYEYPFEKEDDDDFKNELFELFGKIESNFPNDI